MSELLLNLVENPDDFPNVSKACQAPDGLLAFSTKLSEALVIEAYQRGIFPWYEDGSPVLWWCPSQRCVLWPSHLKIRRSLRKRLRNSKYHFTVNCAFEDVIRWCAEIPRKGQNGTWITEDMRKVYISLHRSAIAHSIEVWENDVLIGGLYGIRIGGMFCGESMFSRRPDASKMALAVLCQLSLNTGVSVIDCQLPTEHLMSLGAVTIPRSEFIELLKRERQKSGIEWPCGPIKWQAQ
ncbi:MAG: leucyl/phenylalanyl-tRNA--protein transferase [Gammaproteobacteria bacterium]|nr:MAG: leucyl/phenylalanyl-tRNA--protein transferase [Gammaproteobacteria bacterium]